MDPPQRVLPRWPVRDVGKQTAGLGGDRHAEPCTGVSRGGHSSEAVDADSRVSLSGLEAGVAEHLGDVRQRESARRWRDYGDASAGPLFVSQQHCG